VKRVIAGETYNTETAKCLGQRSDCPDDLNCCTEALYVTKSGRHFMYTYGGPASKYGRRRSLRRWTDAEHIVLVSEAAAKAWLRTLADSSPGPCAGQKEEM